MERTLKLSELRSLLIAKTPVESLKILSALFPGKVIFTTSFGIEDQVLTHQIFSNDISIETVTLDTGRLFPETYKVFNETFKKYQKNIKVYFPDREAVETMVTEKGPFSFYYSKENRIECCKLRKVIPLNRALKGMQVWVSGIRASQSDNRKQMERLEYDDEKKLYKFYPIFDWSFEDVINYVRENGVPYNILHDRGYVSIGCEPCTRAVAPGEDFRSGRWWWESDGQKECGCHVK